jgi:hypothetical protein
VRLAVDRPDPENRPFRHTDAIGWTEANRGQILRALFTLMIGNPRLYMRNPPVAETRFMCDAFSLRHRQARDKNALPLPQPKHPFPPAPAMP